MLPSEALNTAPLGRLRAGAMCTIPSVIDVEAARVKVTSEPVLVLNRDWSAGVGDAQLTGTVSLRAAGTSKSSARAAAARAAGKDTRRDANAHVSGIDWFTVRGLSDDQAGGFRDRPHLVTE